MGRYHVPGGMFTRKTISVEDFRVANAGPVGAGERTLLMGVLNVTPDSFSDGGHFLDMQSAVAHGLELERAGADILDIGGESTRPGAEPISAEEELDRVKPVIERLRAQLRIPISWTRKKRKSAEAGIKAGAEIINDVSALHGGDPALAKIVHQKRVALILMHMRGVPRTMQKGPFARDVVRDVLNGTCATVWSEPPRPEFSDRKFCSTPELDLASAMRRSFEASLASAIAGTGTAGSTAR